MVSCLNSSPLSKDADCQESRTPTGYWRMQPMYVEIGTSTNIEQLGGGMVVLQVECGWLPKILLKSTCNRLTTDSQVLRCSRCIKEYMPQSGNGTKIPSASMQPEELASLHL